jgi:hypothetical protein
LGSKVCPFVVGAVGGVYIGVHSVHFPPTRVFTALYLLNTLMVL